MIFPAHQEALIEGKAYRLLRANVSATLDSFGISIPEWTLLGLLHDGGELMASELADRLGVEAPLVTTLLKQLHEKNLLELRAHPRDNRAKLAALSKKGKEAFQGIGQAVHQGLEPLMKGITPGDIQAYFRVLEQILANGEGGSK